MKSSKGIIDKKQMISVLTDLHLADGYTSMLSGTNKTEVAAIYKAVYKKHNTDSVQVRKSITFYTEDPQELQLMYAQVDSNINRILKTEQDLTLIRQKEEQEKQIRLQAEQNKTDQWRMDSVKMLNGQYDFRLPTYYFGIDYYLTIYRSTLPLNISEKIRQDSIKAIR